MTTSLTTSNYATLSPLDDGEGISKKINVLYNSMCKLEDEISSIAKSIPINQIKVARLRKIQDEIKGQIDRLKSNLIPDIIA